MAWSVVKLAALGRAIPTQRSPSIVPTEYPPKPLTKADETTANSLPLSQTLSVESTRVDTTKAYDAKDYRLPS
jgi:hypothetical protein